MNRIALFLFDFAISDKATYRHSYRHNSALRKYVKENAWGQPADQTNAIDSQGSLFGNCTGHKIQQRAELSPPQASWTKY